MYAKSFIALDSNGHLIRTRTAQRYPYDHYTCHLCGSTLRYHPEYNTERPFFEHRYGMQIDNGRKHCPYVRPEPEEARYSRQLHRFITNVRPLVYRNDWYCSGCDSNYHGERYCLSCQTDEYSRALSDAEKKDS